MMDPIPNPIRRTSKMLALTGVVLLGGAVAAAWAQQAPLHTQSSQPQQRSSTHAAAYGGTSGLHLLHASKQNHQQQLLQLERKFQTVNQRIMKAQEQAVKNAAVKKKQAAFQKALYKKMAQSAPDMKAQINQFQKLGKALRSSADLRKPAFERSKSFDQKLSKFQQLNAQLRPIQQQAANDPQVAKLRSAYVQKLLAQMKKVEPQTSSLLQQRQQLAQTIRSLQPQRTTPPTFNMRRKPSTASHNSPAKGWQQTSPAKH